MLSSSPPWPTLSSVVRLTGADLDPPYHWKSPVISPWLKYFLWPKLKFFRNISTVEKKIVAEIENPPHISTAEIFFCGQNWNLGNFENFLLNFSFWNIPFILWSGAVDASKGAYIKKQVHTVVPCKLCIDQIHLFLCVLSRMKM